MKLADLIKLRFLPASSDLGLLVLRLWLGLSMLLIHGLDKVQKFGVMLDNFAKGGIPKPLGACAILAESVGAALLVLGLAARPAALALAITMGVAFVKAHNMVLTAGDPKSGEMAFIYLAGFVALFLAGPGRFSVDEKL